MTEEDGAVVAVDWGWAGEQQGTALLARARDEIHAYFDGDLQRFTVPMRPVGATAYRSRVWAALSAIPYGETRTYGQIARDTGGSARSVGQANRFNPLPILVPCHRVVAATHLGGFSMEGGPDTKRFLLDLETPVDPAPTGSTAR